MADYSLSQLTEDLTAADSDLVEVSKDNGDGTFTSRKQTRQTLLTGTASQAELDTHEADTANPHQVTAAQVGAPTTAELSAHTGNTSNPHSVTKAQVGLANVDNTSDLNKPVSTATQSALDAKASTTSLNTHTADTANPHSVTKAQVGLSNVDNTADLSKPISTATQTVLDGKASTSHTHDDRYYTETETDTLLSAKADAAEVPATIVEAVVAGTNVTVDNTDPANPVISSSGGGGSGGTVDSVNGQTGVVVLDADDIDDTATTHKFTTAGDVSKLAGIEAGATADMTGAEINAAYEAQLDTNAYTDAEKSKLAGIAAGAQVNEVSAADIADFETTTELNARDTANRSRDNHTGTQAASTISDFDTEVSNNADVAANTAARHSHANSAVLDATTASFTTADEAKLDGIEAGAQVNVSEINDAATTTTNTWSADKISTEITAGGGGGGAGVSSVAKSGETGLTGDVTLSAGTDIALTQSGNNIEIASTASGGGGGSSTPRWMLTFPTASGTTNIPNTSTGGSFSNLGANNRFGVTGAYYDFYVNAYNNNLDAGSFKNLAGTIICSRQALGAGDTGNVYLHWISDAAAGSANSSTPNQIRLFANAGGVSTAASSTTGNGTTATTTSMSTSIHNTDQMISFQQNTSDVKFYAGGTLKTTHTTNLPTIAAGSKFFTGRVTETGGASNLFLLILSQSWTLTGDLY